MFPLRTATERSLDEIPWTYAPKVRFSTAVSCPSNMTTTARPTTRFGR
jgi:hypothetical protein